MYESNFIVRVSGKRPDSFYIDCFGKYTTADIAKITGIDEKAIADIYKRNGAQYDKALKVYYFSSIQSTKQAIDTIAQDTPNTHRGMMVLLTTAEIEYIRKALINEGVNTLHVSNSIKDAIFKKLNSQ